MKVMKGMAIISEVLFLAVVITLIFLVYAIAAPIIFSMQVSSGFDQTKSMMASLDNMIGQVASEGKGSRRSVSLTLGAGTLLLNETTDTIKWSMETDSMIVSPRSMQQTGNLIIGANLDTMAYEGSYGGKPAFILENEILRVYFNETGSSQSPGKFNTSEILLGVFNKRLSRWMPLKALEISVDQSSNSTLGYGYTELLKEGYALPAGTLLAHINTTYSFMDNYTIAFSLESGADFIIIGAES